jgi:predicted nucleic acid-binding protein
MEAKRVLIDTSVLIDYFRKQKKHATLFVQLARDYEIAISVVTEFEWLVGFKDSDLEFGRELLNNIDILPFDSNCAIQASDIYRRLKAQNQLIEIPDIFIAATSLSYNLPIATINKNHFKRIQGVEFV